MRDRSSFNQPMKPSFKKMVPFFASLFADAGKLYDVIGNNKLYVRSAFGAKL